MRSDSDRSYGAVQSEVVSTESIEQHLGQLIRHYIQTRSPAIAGAVVSHIELLCAHPRFEGGGNELCAYLRLKTHWRWLAMAPTEGPGGLAT